MTETEWKSAKLSEIECAKENCRKTLMNRIYKMAMEIKLIKSWAYQNNSEWNFVIKQ